MAQAGEQATSMLRDLILSGEFSAGDRLGEADMAARLEVSRTPVREALSRLAAEGLVELVANRGARVVRWSTEDLEQIFELRLRLEPYAVGLAVPRLRPQHLDELHKLAQSMCEVGKPGPTQDLDAIVTMNRRFHGVLIEQAGNPSLAASLLAVTHAAVVHQNFHDYGEAALARSLAHHVEIVAAARAGDQDWAGHVMASHLFNARATMLGPDSRRSDAGDI